MIAQNQADLAHVELIAHQMGVPVLTELSMEKNENEINNIEHSLLSHESHIHGEHDMELLSEDQHLPALDTSLLEEGADEDQEYNMNMVELANEITRRSRRLEKSNDYAYLDDPKHGGKPNALSNLKGLDIYVVNTPLADNSNEIRPVAPPKPMSAALRARAKRAAWLKKQLIHDIPVPKATIKPKTRIDTMSAYEPSLVDTRPLRKLSRLAARDLADPIVGSHGSRQLRDTRRKSAGSARFQQIESRLPGTGSLPVFPKDPKAPRAVVSVVGVGSSFDNRDGPPALLNDLLPLKAQLVEELDPLGLSAKSKESVPVGWSL